MRFANLSSVAVLGLVAGTAFAEPQLTVLRVPNSGMVRGEPSDVEPATTGDVAYINAWAPDDVRPGEGYGVILEWRRSTNAFRHIQTLHMTDFQLLGISEDGSSMSFCPLDFTGQSWSNWSTATGTRTNFSSLRPQWTDESLDSYVGYDTSGAPGTGAYFVQADASIVPFPSPELTESITGVNAEGIAYGMAFTSPEVAVPFTWVAGESVRLLPQLPGETTSMAVAVTDRGEVIVRRDPPGGYTAVPHYRWTPDGGYQMFATLPANNENYWRRRVMWSSSGRLYLAASGFQDSVVWSQERGLEPAAAYLSSRGVNLSAEGLTSIVYKGMKAGGRIFWGTARRDGAKVAWFVTDVPLPCVADFNGDGFLDFFDYDAYVIAFEAGDMAADTNGDGFLDFFDYDQFVATFEIGC